MPLFFRTDPLLCQRSESGLESMVCRSLSLLPTPSFGSTEWIFSGILGGFSTVGLSVKKESISNRGLRGLLLNLRLLFSLHSRIPTNEGLPELVIEYLRPHLE